VNAALLGTVARKDGSLQVTYNKMPLYHFAKDKAAGDTIGQGVGSVWFVVAPTGDAIKSAATGSGPVALGGPGQTVDVSVSDYQFSPKVLTVKKGTIVKWTNQGQTNHTVTADDGTTFKSNISVGQSFTFTFDKTGTYAYYCSLHGAAGGQGMSGTITVVE
jgi:plastocyanin